MPIQDNLNGALLISAIDFIMSFIIIGGIGAILALFPLLNRFCKQNDKGALSIALKQTRHTSSVSLEASQSVQPAESGCNHTRLSDQQLLVLLTAAVFETLGRTVRIKQIRQLTARSSNWAVEGRSNLQSHHLK
jgi:hypothetical protein